MPTNKLLGNNDIDIMKQILKEKFKKNTKQRPKHSVFLD